MINIREDLVFKGTEVTKNGYVVMSLEKYLEMIDEIQKGNALEERFGSIDIYNLLLETEKELDNPDTKYLTHEEVYSKARSIIDSK